MLFSWRDENTWRVLFDSLRPGQRSAALIVKRLPTLFDGITVYHAARPRAVANYYERGLQLGKV